MAAKKPSLSAAYDLLLLEPPDRCIALAQLAQDRSAVFAH
jgi:hypothetical protein